MTDARWNDTQPTIGRRFNNVAGKPSFSTLYTAINVMAGHYASYGPKVI